ncbi:MAG: ABC transporter permease [Pseudomonadota bacterium]
MRTFSAKPTALFQCIWRNRSLIAASARREVVGRYQGSIFGLLWSFFNPLLMLAVYTFVFTEVFKARWSSNGYVKVEFALVLFAGLIVFNIFSECINRAPNLILANPNYVKKVVFPLEVLPVIILISSLYHALVGMFVWFVAYIIFVGMPNWSAVLLPLLLLPFSLFVLGLSWILASLGVFLRDVSQFVAVITTVLLFMSPIFYPVNALPEIYHGIVYFNPITPIVEMVREILYWGIWVRVEVIAGYWLFCMLIAWIGFAWFQKTRKGFADVL